MPWRFNASARVCVVAAFAALTAACAGQQARIPYTAQEAMLAQPVGYEHIRVWLDETRDNPPEFAPDIKPGEVAQYLALSGGGGNGAYGAGVLNGWTQSGKRPTFNAVSGVSTGALMAPFAFLGPAYDSTVADIYTGGEAATLVSTPDIGGAAFGSSLFGGRKLLDLVTRYVDADIVAAIAREHKAGRRLYVVTTNIDAKRGVVWNIGAIAASGQPDSIDLIRKVLAASASVPLAFAPQLIDVTADGHAFQEMHADGNVTTAVFTLPLKYLAAQRRTRLAGRRDLCRDEHGHRAAILGGRALDAADRRRFDRYADDTEVGGRPRLGVCLRQDEQGGLQPDFDRPGDRQGGARQLRHGLHAPPLRCRRRDREVGQLLAQDADPVARAGRRRFRGRSEAGGRSEGGTAKLAPRRTQLSQHNVVMAVTATIG